MYSCTEEGCSGDPTWAHAGSAAHCVSLSAISARDSWGGPYCPVGAERLGAGRFVAALDREGLPVASPPQEMAAMTASMTCVANWSFRGAWR